MSEQEQKIRETLDELIADGTVKPLRRHKVALGDKKVMPHMIMPQNTVNAEFLITGEAVGNTPNPYATNMPPFWHDVLYANGLWVAAGPSAIMVSQNGFDWIMAQSISVRPFTVVKVDYHAGYWYVFAGQVWFSDDGFHWGSVLWNLHGERLLTEKGLFVMGDRGGIAKAVEDGRVWEHVFAPGSVWNPPAPPLGPPGGWATAAHYIEEMDLWLIFFSQNVFIRIGTDDLVAHRWLLPNHAAGYAHLVPAVLHFGETIIITFGRGLYTSIDGGLTWELVLDDVGPGNSRHTLLKTDGNVILFTTISALWVSTNGLTWTDVLTGFGSSYDHRITLEYLDNYKLWVLATYNGVFTSSDGTNWDRKTPPLESIPTSCMFGNGRFVISSGRTVVSSSDLVSWDVFTFPDQLWWEYQHDSVALTFNNGLWISAGNGRIFGSIDTITWHRLTIIPDSGYLSETHVIAFYDDLWVVSAYRHRLPESPIGSLIGQTTILTGKWLSQTHLSEIRNFHLDANPEIKFYLDPENNPPEELLPLLENESGQKYVQIKNGIRLVGRIHVIDEIINKTGEWRITTEDADAPEVTIDQNGILFVPEPEEEPDEPVQYLYKIKLVAKYNARFDEVAGMLEIEPPG